MTGLVENWFGKSFQNLDPLIQRLHQHDHVLKGTVQIEYALGFPGKVGRTLARKFDIPTVSGSTSLTVNINQNTDHFLWSRQFGDNGKRMDSRFYPVGSYPNGGWRESTGAVDVTLGVEIINAGWHWKQKSVKFHGVSTPLIASPKVVAYKEVVDGKYNFYVEFLMPGLGSLFTYKGLLTA